MRKTGIVFLFSCLATAQAPSQDSAEKRAADLVAKMTLEEKVLQMQNNAPAIPRLNVPAYEWWNEALHGVPRAGQATVFPQAIGLAATWDVDLIHPTPPPTSTEPPPNNHEPTRTPDPP